MDRGTCQATVQGVTKSQMCMNHKRHIVNLFLHYFLEEHEESNKKELCKVCFPLTPFFLKSYAFSLDTTLQTAGVYSPDMVLFPLVEMS